MKRITLIGTVLAIAMLGLASTSSAVATALEPSGGVMFESYGPEGVLRVVNAVGRPIEVFDSYGGLVHEGVVPAEQFEMACPDTGPDALGVRLRVHLGGGDIMCVDRDSDWIWE